MFNRAIQVKVVKTDKNDAMPIPAQSDSYFEKKVSVIGHYIERTVGKAGKAVIAYVAVDTLRQILVARAMRR